MKYQSATTSALFALIIGLLFLTFNQSIKAQILSDGLDPSVQTSKSLPTVRGDEAIEKLKQTGQYDSLMDAVKASRKDNGQTDEPQTEDAIGQNIKLTASDGLANDLFGFSVAISGDTAIVGAQQDDVGANSNQGSVYIFVRNGTTWTQQQQLFATGGAADDQFGYSVAISGDTAIVGAYADDVGANTNQGSAYVFTRSGTTWTQQQQLFATDGLANDLFGYSVAISGDTAIVGAVTDTVGANVNQGSAYVYTRSGTVWTQQQQLFAADGSFNDQFGYSVAIDGDTAIVGAPFDDVGANTDQGSAYVFTRSGTVWTQQQQLFATGGAVNDRFGYSVAISGNNIIVGAYLDDVGEIFNQGSAYVFTRSGGVWTQQQQLFAMGGAVSDLFGFSVAISGDTAIVGAPFDDVGANTDQGSAYVFTRSGITWTQQPQLNAADGAVSDRFGYSVAISGNNMIVGAYLDDVGANTDQGSAYVFRVLGGGWTQEAQKVASDGLADDNFGFSVAINGDTAIVGAYRDDVGANANQGSAYVFVRSGTTWTQQQQLTASDGALSDQFGYSVAIYGDTLIVGAYLKNIGVNNSQGAAYVFTRSGTTWTQQQQLTASDGATLDRFGYSVGISGNTVIVGAYLNDVGANSDQGSAYVFTRSGITWTQQAQLTASNGGTTDQFGQSVTIFGNTAVVGAAFADVGANTNQGSVYVYVRSGVTWTEQQILTASDAAAQDSFGYTVSLSNETLVIGAPSNDVGAISNQGSAYVFTRSGVIWTEQQQLTATNGLASDQFGFSVSLDGDTAIIGANLKDVGGNVNQGSAYVFARNGSVWTQQQELFAAGGGALDQFGYIVGISGDKIIVGAPFSDAGSSIPLAPQAFNQGAMFVFINSPLAPTAANVSVGGKVRSNDGRGLANAIVVLTDSRGISRTARTGSFGYFKFDEVTVGETYVVSVRSKRYQFNPQVIQVEDNITDLELTANQ